VLIALLVALGVVASVVPHAPNFTPVAATALFAASVLRFRRLAVVVPLAAMAISGLVLGFGDYRITAVVSIALALPALAGFLTRRVGLGGIVAILLSSALTFFAATNLAVWAFSGLYPLDMNGLLECYVAALPFLKNTVAGNLFWATALFGGYWLLQRISARRAAAMGR
jgi:hypothetical protein